MSEEIVVYGGSDGKPAVVNIGGIKAGSRAVADLPGWIGSTAVTETGKQWMSEARVALQLSAEGFMSEMAGKSVPPPPPPPPESEPEPTTK